MGGLPSTRGCVWGGVGDNLEDNSWTKEGSYGEMPILGERVGGAHPALGRGACPLAHLRERRGGAAYPCGVAVGEGCSFLGVATEEGMPPILGGAARRGAAYP